jgi:NlpC/P60 family protein
MSAALKSVLLTIILAGAVCNAPSQAGPQHRPNSHAVLRDTVDRRAGHGQALDDEDRLSLIAAALDRRVQSAEPDCSHLVHAIYEKAGFEYAYAPSPDLYAGVDGFQRVKEPNPGDLVVWRGHVGIVIKPSRHIFFSLLSSGPGTDDYTTSYWKHRGKARFYRYVKSGLQ